MASSPVALDVRWRPFQLDGTLPASGKDRAAYLSEKFGSLERARELYANIQQAGEDEGIPFEFARIAVSPNTLDAHRLIRWAGGVDAATQDAVVEGLFRAYFVEGRHIGEHGVLVDVAASAGMDSDLVAKLLKNGADRDLVGSEIDLSHRMGVTGVPTFILGNKYVVVGAQSGDALRDAFIQVSKALAMEPQAEGALDHNQES